LSYLFYVRITEYNPNYVNQKYGREQIIRPMAFTCDQ